MDEVFKCDRCGETFNMGNWFNLNMIEARVYNTGCPQDYSFNLCPSCMAVLNDWLKGEQK